MNMLALVSDAFGGRGGIALYNRNLLTAICRHPCVDKVTAVPRSITYNLEKLPENLTYLSNAAEGKISYLITFIKLAFSLKRVDLIFCGHLHLLPFAYLLKFFFNCPVIGVVYGVEAWTPTPHRIANYFCRKLESFISIRKLTAKKLNEWTGRGANGKFYYLPNCIDQSQYGVAAKSPELLKKYGLENKLVIMTAGRLDAGEIDRNKGFDEVLEVLPDLQREMPDLSYLIMGDGEEKQRLSQKARELGVDDIVVFTGYVPDEEKADHYRLADVFAMPGSNKIFDRYPYRFVFLEALACGVPVVGSRLEDESEANDPDAKQLIIQVDPNSKDDIKRGIIGALKRSRGTITGIDKFYYPVFEDKVHRIINDILGCSGSIKALAGRFN